MLEENEELFERFAPVHQAFIANPETAKAQFNKIGSEVLYVVRRYENILCGSTERSSYSKFSSNLSEKFWGVIRVIFPKIDYIGIK